MYGKRGFTFGSRRRSGSRRRCNRPRWGGVLGPLIGPNGFDGLDALSPQALPIYQLGLSRHPGDVSFSLRPRFGGVSEPDQANRANTLPQVQQSKPQKVGLHHQYLQIHQIVGQLAHGAESFYVGLYVASAIEGT